MTNVVELISSVSQHIPFQNGERAQQFLDQYSTDDQAALISALYIGRDHIHDLGIRPDYVPTGWRFDRFFTTGREPKWDIHPNDFARILYEKNTNLHRYYDAFIQCMEASQYSLDEF